MNNSKLALESLDVLSEEKRGNASVLREQEARLIRLITALQEVQATQAWSSLKTELFDDLPKGLKRDLLMESRKDNPDTLRLNRLAGQLKWAEKYADLSKLEQQYRVELQGIKLQLNGNS